VLLDERMMAVPRVRSDGDGMGWRWLAMVNTVQVEESRAEAVVRERERRRKWIRSSPRGVHTLDKDEVRRFNEGGAPGLAVPARWRWLRSGWRQRGESQGAGWLPTGPGPLKYFSNEFQSLSIFEIQKQKPSRDTKIFKLHMSLDLSLRNNFLH
jgi:hypothetical protein